MSKKINVRKLLGDFFSKNVTLSIGINSVFLILIIVFCDMKYEVSDDYMMDAVLSGGFDNFVNPYLLFSNLIYGWLLKPFYILFPDVSWYFIFQLLMCFSSLCAVTYVVLEKNNRLLGVILSVLFVSFFSDDLYLLMQFTKTATIAICAGGTLFLFGIWGKDIRKDCVIVGTILTICGSWIRYYCVYISLVYLLLIFVKFSLDNRSNEKIWNKTVRNFTLCFALLMLAFVCKFANDQVRNQSELYSKYVIKNTIRSNLIDAPNYGYDSISGTMEENGLDETDYWMMRSWNILDQDIYSNQVLDTVAHAKVQYHSQNEISIKQIVRRFIDRGYQHYTIVFGIFIISMVILFFTPQKVMSAFMGIFITALVLMYFYITGRVVYRVEYSVFLGLAIYLLMLINVDEITDTQKQSVLILGVMLLFFKIPLYIPDDSYKSLSDEEYSQYVYDVMNNSADYNVKKYRICISKRQPQKDLLNYMEENDEYYYMLDFVTAIQRIYLNYPPWERIEAGCWKDYYYLGSVTYGYYNNDICWKNKGIDILNPNKSLVNENILVIDNVYSDTKLEYLRKYYYPNARKEKYISVDGFDLWKYYKD